MTSPTPPWRVFDAPSETPDAANGREPGAVGTARAGDRGGSESRASGVQPTTLAAIGGAVVLAAAAIVIALGSLGAGGAVDAAGGSTVPGGSDPAAAGTLVVEVAGAVVRPGVYHLPPGARVADAVAAAGGFGPRVAAARVEAEINLAALIRDGDRIVVPSRDSPSGTGPAPATGASAGPDAHLIDLNHATAAELDTLPGVGPVTADRIIASRAEKPFASVDELKERGLIGAKAFEKIQPLVTVG
jgi:competence protein ComEA